MGPWGSHQRRCYERTRLDWLPVGQLSSSPTGSYYPGPRRSLRVIQGDCRAQRIVVLQAVRSLPNANQSNIGRPCGPYIGINRGRSQRECPLGGLLAGHQPAGEIIAPGL